MRRFAADQTLLKLIRNGDVSHARGLSARLRVLLLTGGRQKPLLQTVAALKAVPLIDDIDVWLNLRGMLIENTDYAHWQIISDLANTKVPA